MEIVNKYNHRPSQKDVCVMRPSLLGNPFHIGRDGSREEVVAKYRQWLGQKVRVEQDTKIIAALRSIPEDANLLCCCAPRLCHAEVIRDACRWLRNHPEHGASGA